MDARDYDRIADLLMQIRKKYKNLNLKDDYDQHRRRVLLVKIDEILKMNDKFADWNDKGWL